MMKKMAYAAIVATFSVQGFAQANFDDEMNTELDRLYDQGQTPRVHSPQRRQQGALITQQQQIIQPQIQVYKQPTTVIEASPLTESNAEKMRRSRQETELLTEQKIVEKLEASRMEDEKRRAEMLFGDKFNQMMSSAGVPQSTHPVVTPVTQPPVVQAPVTPVQVVTVPEVAPALDREDVRNEVTAALEDLKAQEKSQRKPYFSFSAGLGDYPSVRNVRGNYSLGFTLGQLVNERMIVDGGFQYSNFDIQQINPNYYLQGYPRITNMDVYQASISLKYQVMQGLFRPVVGGVAAYTYRTFTDTQFGWASNNATAHALDIGFVAGADVAVNDEFSLGLEYKYMLNLTSRTQTDGLQLPFSQVVNNGGTPIEKLGYSNISFTGKMTF